MVGASFPGWDSWAFSAGLFEVATCPLRLQQGPGILNQGAYAKAATAHTCTVLLARCVVGSSFFPNLAIHRTVRGGPSRSSPVRAMAMASRTPQGRPVCYSLDSRPRHLSAPNHTTMPNPHGKNWALDLEAE